MPAKNSNLKKVRGRRVLVTGATGFIGAFVARRLASLGAEVWITGRDLDALAETCRKYKFSASLIEADLSRRGEVSRVVARVRPDIIFNLAGYGVDPGERNARVANSLNARLPRDIAIAAAKSSNANWRGVQIIHAGSAAEYGPVRGRVSETTRCRPLALYGKSKLAGTRALLHVCSRLKVCAVVARIFNVYGPGEHSARLLPSLMVAARTGKKLRMTPGLQRRDFAYVEDVAEGLVRLACAPLRKSAIVNLATGRLSTVREFVVAAAAALKMKSSQLQFGALPYRGDESAQGTASNSKLLRLTGWLPSKNIRAGVRRTVAFLKKSRGANS